MAALALAAFTLQPAHRATGTLGPSEEVAQDVLKIAAATGKIAAATGSGLAATEHAAQQVLQAPSAA